MFVAPLWDAVRAVRPPWQRWGGPSGSVQPAKATWIALTIDPFMVSQCKTALNQRVIFTTFSPAWCVQHTILEFNNCMLSWGGQS